MKSLIQKSLGTSFVMLLALSATGSHGHRKLIKASALLILMTFIAAITGCNKDVEIQYVEAVTFTTEDAGDSGIKVTMACETEGASIYYTTEDSDPSDSSTVYTEAVTFKEDTTVKAIACKEGMEDSPVSVVTVSIKTKTITEKESISDNESNVEKKIKEIEKFVYTTTVPAGTYTVYHLQQKTTGGKTVSDYDLQETENSKVLSADSLLTDLQKTYTGFEAVSLAQNETSLYVFYDRITVTFTFNTGSDGKFSNGKTTASVSGLYGSKVIPPANPISTTGKYFTKWVNNGEVLIKKYGTENLTFTAVWVTTFTPVDDYILIDYEDGDFYISSTELKYSDWYEVFTWGTANGYLFANLGREGSEGVDGAEPTENNNQPVTHISWRDCIVWCNAASEKAGLTPVYTYNNEIVKTSAKHSDYYGSNPACTNYEEYGCSLPELATVNPRADGYRLPTAAEWVYAAKGGENYIYSGSDDAYEVGWIFYNSYPNSQAVGCKSANGYGLYDMTGNLAEWLQDKEENDPYNEGFYKWHDSSFCTRTLEECEVTFIGRMNCDYSLTSSGLRPVRTFR